MFYSMIFTSTDVLGVFDHDTLFDSFFYLLVMFLFFKFYVIIFKYLSKSKRV